MVEVKQSFVKYDSLLDEDKKSISFDKLFVEVKGVKIPLKDLYLIKSNKKGVIKTEKIKSFAEFDKNILNGKVCTDDKGNKPIVSKFEVLYEAFAVPTISDGVRKTGSSVDQSIDTGLRRTISIKEATLFDREKLFYIQTAEGWCYSKVDDFYWYDGAIKKTYSDYLALSEDNKENTKLYTKDALLITAIYTEKQFKADSLIAQEEFDFSSCEKKVYTLDKDLKPVYKTIKANKSISYQSFETKTVEAEMGKKETKSMVKVTNYQASTQGEYASVMVDNQLKVVKISDLVDENGNSITDLTLMFGKVVKIKEGDKIVTTTKPLTFEQANIRYDSIKTYQEVEGGPSKDSCLRLEDGTYVEELNSVQPNSFKRAVAGGVADNYLVEKNGVFFVVGNDYFATHSTSEFDPAKAVPLTRCDFKDKDCEIIQTTAKGEEKELCTAVKDGISVNGKSMTREKKDDIYAAFLKSYKEDKYKTDNVYVNGKRQKIQKNSKRYEYTNVSYHEDYADSLGQYQALKTTKLELKDGKIVGGGKYDIGKGIAKAYSKWFKVLKIGLLAICSVSLIFFPIAVPLSGAFALGMFAATPFIPVAQVAIGLKKNVFERKKFTDKTEYNRKECVKDFEKELLELNSRTDLTQKGFEDVYSKIMNKIAMLSATTTNNTLKFDGEQVEVNKNNVNLANEFKQNFNKNAKSLENVNNLVAQAQKKFNKIDAKKNKYGSNVPNSVLNKWYKAKEELDKLTEEQKALQAEQEKLKNYSTGKSYSDATLERENLERKAIAVKIKAYLENTASTVAVDKKWSVSPVIQTKLDAIRSKVVCDEKLDIKIDGVSVFASEDMVKTQTTSWKADRDIVMEIVEDLKSPEIEKPVDANVVDEIDRFKLLEQFNELVVEFENKITAVQTELAKVKDSEHTALEDELKRIIKAKEDAKNIANNAVKPDDIQQQIDIVTQESENLKTLAENIQKAIKKQAKQTKEQNEVNNITLKGEKDVFDKIGDLLNQTTLTEEDQHIMDALLTETGLKKKELVKKMKEVYKKLEENIANNENTTFKRGYSPYTIVQTIARKLNVNGSIFDPDPNQFSIPI